MNRNSSRLSVLFTMAAALSCLFQSGNGQTLQSSNPPNSSAPAAYRVPFSSSGNAIELAIYNEASLPTFDVTVAVDAVPAWISVSPKVITVSEIEQQQESSVRFVFSVAQSAPVDRETSLRFSITTADGQRWQKEFSIAVNAPERFELFQNFPNPFNPQTTIQYTLPNRGFVRLNVYDVLGQAIRTLVDGEQEAGMHTVDFDAGDIPSGVYFYRIQAGNLTDTKKLFLLR